ncbi:MAG: HipA domain-containing protein [Pirellulaceae bacterium]
MKALSVHLGETQIGLLEHFDDESEVFTFSENYVDRHIDSRPVLGQLFEDRIPKQIRVGGPMGWFEHLLPQGVMRRWRARLLGIEENDSFEMLSYLGEQLPGAVVLRPTRTMIDKGPFLQSRSHELPSDTSFRFSLAGVQWKLSARSQGRGLTTNASASGSEYIAKFDSPEYPNLPRCEFATMHWAKLSGLTVPEFQMRNVADFDRIPENMPFGNGEVYLCERFDRCNSQRIHMEDFAQILDRPSGREQYRGSYDEIARVLQWIAPDKVDELLRIVVFNICCGNGDAHLKNFSVLYEDGRTANLSPSYDLVATVAYINSNELALDLGASKRFDNLDAARFQIFSDCLGLSLKQLVIRISEYAEKSIDSWLLKDVKDNYTTLQCGRIEQHVAAVAKQFRALKA